MVLVSTDERELLLPLAEGIHERPMWASFLRRLVARTGADHVCLQVLRSGRAEAVALERNASRPGAVWQGLSRLTETGLVSLAGLRPGRVFALGEMIESAAGARRDAQQAALAKSGLRDARMVRTAWRDDLAAGLIVLSGREDLRAADSALLDSLMPHLAAATATLAALEAARWQALEGGSLLARLGIGQVGLDREARVVFADGSAGEVLGERLAFGQRLLLTSEPGRLLAEACDALAGASRSAWRMVRIDAERGIDLLVRPAQDVPPLAPQVAVVALLRNAAREDAGVASQMLSTSYGLSAREAALAVALSRGETIVEAGARLHLTVETARNYSKRIYAKTGARGQADLVRLVLTGLAALA